MACWQCGQQRQALVQSARAYDPRGMVQAVTRGAAIAIDKMRGVDIDKKYGGKPPVNATPYRRPPERST